MSGYDERFDFRMAFDFIGKEMGVEHNSAQNCLRKNSRDTLPIRPTTNQVLFPQDTGPVSRASYPHRRQIDNNSHR